MAPDSSASPCSSGVPVPAAASSGPRDKVRLRFRKDGSLRWLSHHDLLRTFERMLRRSELPFRSTKGFNPHPRVVFALSLPLGVIGCAEVVELELDEPLPPEEVRVRLAAQCPSGLAILSARRIDPKVTARVTGFSYGLTVPPERREGLPAKIEEALRSEECWVERSKPERRRLNVRPFVRALRYEENTSSWLEMDLWLTPSGTARPEEVLGLVGLGGLLQAGAPLERVRLDLQDEDQEGGGTP